MTINLKQIHKFFPTEHDAILLLEEVFWGGVPKCPYCGSLQATPIKGSRRYKCNTCENSFSVTVNTMFHRTKVDLRNWIYLLVLMSSGSPLPSLRILGEEMSLTKDTVAKMEKKIRSSYLKDKTNIDKLLNKIIDG